MSELTTTNNNQLMSKRDVENLSNIIKNLLLNLKVLYDKAKENEKIRIQKIVKNLQQISNQVVNENKVDNEIKEKIKKVGLEIKDIKEKVENDKTDENKPSKIMLEVNSNDLNKGLSVIGKAVNPKASLDELRCIRLDLSENIIEITSLNNNNITYYLTYKIGCKCNLRKHHILINYDVLSASIKKIKNETLTITIDEKKLYIKSLSGNVEINLIEGEFPLFIRKNAYPIRLEFQQSELKKCLNRITSVIDFKDETNIFKSSIYLDILKDKINFVTTEGSRLSLFEFPNNTGIQEKNFLINIFPIYSLNRELGNVGYAVMEFDDETGKFQVGNLTITTQLIKNTMFPSYPSLLRKLEDSKFDVNANELLAKLDILNSFLLKGKEKRITCYIEKDNLTIKAKNDKDEPYKEEIKIRNMLNTKEVFPFSFNVELLKQIITPLKNCNLTIYIDKEYSIVTIFDNETTSTNLIGRLRELVEE